MKRLLVPLAILLITAFIITGCGSPTTTTTTKPAATTPTSTTPGPTSTTTSPAVTKPTTTTPTTPSPTGASKYGGILKYAHTASPGTPIGWIPETFGGATITIQLVMEFPIKEMSDASLVPWLAESWTEDPATNSITMKIKRGIKFSDGTDYNAKAVK